MSGSLLPQHLLERLWRPPRETSVQKTCLHSTELPIRNLNASERATGVKGKRCSRQALPLGFWHSSKRELPKGRLSRFAESCSAHGCWKAQQLPPCSLCGSRGTTAPAKEWAARAGARREMLTAPVRSHAAWRGVWEKKPREISAGVKPASCCRNYSLKMPSVTVRIQIIFYTRLKTCPVGFHRGFLTREGVTF